MLTHTQDWHPLNPKQKLDRLRGVEAELIAVRRMIPELADDLPAPVQERAWNALTDEQQFALVLECEIQRDNARDYLASLGRTPAAVPPSGCGQRAHLQHAATAV